MAFIDVVSVSKSYAKENRRRHVLDRISLAVDRGEFVSIVGFMGCGKSTLLNILSGLESPDSGHVRFDGTIATSVRADAAIVFQNYSLLPWFSSLENVRLAVAAAFPEWPRARQTSQARRYLEAVGLGSALERRPGQLSGGMRQRVAIARAFATEPQVLFLDEPFGALDALTRASLQQELARLCSAAGRPVTAVMITNSVEEALLLSDRIIPMTRGPRATLGLPVAVEIPKPRSLSRLLHDEQAMHVRAHVVAALTTSVESARRASPEDAGITVASKRRVAAAPNRSEA